MRFGLFSFALVILPALLIAETRHIHVIKLLDNENDDPIIREGCRSINFGIDREVALLADFLGIDNVIEYNLSGPNFSLDKLDDVLTYEMSYQERDIILLAYVGHGYREPNAGSPFPRLYFKGYDHSVAYEDIQERLQDMNPSLLLNIVIACNVTLYDQSSPPPYESVNTPPEIVSLKGMGANAAIAYRHLFADETGYTKVVHLISAEPGQYTFISNDGGVFFNEIQFALHDLLAMGSIQSWDELCRVITQRTALRSERLGTPQVPLCQYEVRLMPVNVTTPQARMRSILSPTPCELAARDMRQQHRQELRELRRIHRQHLREVKANGAGRQECRLLAQEHRVEYENRKLQHERAYQRRLLQC